MATRLLSVLEYPDVDRINMKDESTFRKAALWLEKEKINKASPTVFKSLSDISSKDWDSSFKKYIKFLGFPEHLTTKEEELHWLSGFAIQKQYATKKDVYNKHCVDNISKSNVPQVVTENPLDKLDLRSKEFTEGINEVAKILDIVAHPDPIVTLKAVTYVVTKRLTPHALEHPDQYIVKGTPFPVQDADLGIDIADPGLKKAAKVLRMLYIQDLRDLQTKANELIVAVQNVTANPKTDTRLGKVGR